MRSYSVRSEDTCARVVALSTKTKYVFGSRKCGTHARVFAETMANVTPIPKGPPQ